MNVSTLQNMRATILGAFMILALAVGVPLIVNAQDATPQATPAPSSEDLIAEGDKIFNTICLACHQPEGKGVEGIFPALAGNAAITLEDPTYLITVLLNGRGGMPRWDTTYSDEQIAGIASYVRQAWGNDASPVTPEQVAEVRASFVAPAVTTPEGQIPNGSGRATPDLPGTPEATPSN